MSFFEREDGEHECQICGYITLTVEQMIKHYKETGHFAVGLNLQETDL